MAYSLIRDPKGLQQVTQPITNFLKDTQLSTVIRSNQAHLAEFSEEITNAPTQKTYDIDYKNLC